MESIDKLKQGDEVIIGDPGADVVQVYSQHNGGLYWAEGMDDTIGNIATITNLMHNSRSEFLPWVRLSTEYTYLPYHIYKLTENDY